MTHLHPQDTATQKDKLTNLASGVSLVLVSVLVMTLSSVGVLLGIRYVGGTSEIVSFVLLVVVSQGIGLGAVSLLYARKYGTDEIFFDFNRENLVRDVSVMVGLAVVMLIAGGIGTLISTTFGVETAENTVQTTLESDVRNVYAFIVLSLVIIGPLEELFYRGTVQKHFTKVFSDTQAVVLAALLFSVIHIPSLIGDGPASFVPYLAVLFVGGLAFGFAYSRTQNLAVPMIGHGLYNALLGVFFLL